MLGVISGYEILVVALAVAALLVLVGAGVIGVVTRFVRGDVGDAHARSAGSRSAVAAGRRLRTWLAGRSPGR